VKLRGHALALRIARTDDEKDGRDIELSCQLCGRAILEYEVDNGNVGCIGLQPNSAMEATVCTAKPASSR